MLVFHYRNDDEDVVVSVSCTTGFISHSLSTIVVSLVL